MPTKRTMGSDLLMRGPPRLRLPPLRCPQRGRNSRLGAALRRSSRLLDHLHRARRTLHDAEPATLAVVGQHDIAAGLALHREIGTVVNAVVALDAGATRKAAFGLGERLLQVETDLHL